MKMTLEDGLWLRLQGRRSLPSGQSRQLPVYRGRSGLANGIDPGSNRSMLDAAADNS